MTTLFHLKKVTIEWETIFFPQQCNKENSMILSTLDKKAKTIDEKISLIKELQWIGFKSDCIDKFLINLLNLYGNIQSKSNN